MGETSVELQGDQRERLRDLLAKKGWGGEGLGIRESGAADHFGGAKFWFGNGLVLGRCNTVNGWFDAW